MAPHTIGTGSDQRIRALAFDQAKGLVDLALARGCDPSDSMHMGGRRERAISILLSALNPSNGPTNASPALTCTDTPCSNCGGTAYTISPIGTAQTGSPLCSHCWRHWELDLDIDEAPVAQPSPTLRASGRACGRCYGVLEGTGPVCGGCAAWEAGEGLDLPE